MAHDRRWLKAVAPLACLTAVALVAADYRVPADIVGGAAVGLAVGLTTVRWLSKGPVPADR